MLTLQYAVPVQVQKIRVTDVQGKQYRLSHKNNEINISSLSPGIYLLNVETNMGVWVQKFVKE